MQGNGLVSGLIAAGCVAGGVGLIVVGRQVHHLQAQLRAVKAVPCTAAQANRAVIHGGSENFALPNGQKIKINAPHGWCIEK